MDLERRRALLIAGLSFLRLLPLEHAPKVRTLATGMNSWPGLGAVVAGLRVQRSDTTPRLRLT